MNDNLFPRVSGTLVAYLIALTMILGGVTSANAQAGAPDDSFTAFRAAYVSALPQPDGKVVISGGFQQIGEVARNGLARLNADGSLDGSFDPASGFSDVSYGSQLARLSDGSILFTRGRQQEYTTHQKLYRCTATGTIVSAFATLPGANESIDGFRALTNDQIYIWGGFSQVAGVARNGLARLNSLGQVDGAFAPQLPSGSWVSRLAVGADGSVIVLASALGELRLYRLSNTGVVLMQKTLDLACDYFGDYPFVGNLVVQADGKIVLAGMFDSMGGITRRGVARLNADGSIDSSFNVDFLKANTKLYDLHLQATGKMILMGKLRYDANGSTISAVRISGNGSLDESFDVAANSGADHSVLSGGSIKELADGRLLAFFYKEQPPYPGGSGGVIIVGPPNNNFDPSYQLVRLLGDANARPHRPSITIVEPMSPTGTRIEWKKVANVTGYQVERLQGNAWVTLAHLPSAQTSYLDEGLDGVTNHSYRVTAKNTFGAGLASVDKKMPLPGSFLVKSSAAPTSPTRVSISWPDVSGEAIYEVYRKDGADIYNIYRSTYQGDAPGSTWLLGGGLTLGDTIDFFPTPPPMTLLVSLPAGATSYVDNTASPSANYVYQVVARNVAGQKVTEGIQVEMPPDLPPQRVESLLVSPGSGQSVRLAWRKVRWATGYILERRAPGGVWSEIAHLGGDMTAFVDDQDFPEDLTYQYRVQAINSVGSSEYSDVKSVVTPAPSWTVAGREDASFSRLAVDALSEGSSGSIYGRFGSSSSPVIFRLSPDGGMAMSVSLSSSFNTVSAHVVMSNEQIWVTGAPLVSHHSRIRAYRPDGTEDTQVVFPRFYGDISMLYRLKNGKVLALGNFGTVGTESSKGIARLNADGTLDSTFSMTGISGVGTSPKIAEQSDGSVILVLDRRSVIRVRPNGTRDMGFGKSGTVDANGYPFSLDGLAIQTDDSIVLGGGFEGLNDGWTVSKRPIINRLTKDGMIDPTFQGGGGFPLSITPGGSAQLIYQQINQLFIDSQQRILVAGNLVCYDGQPVRRILRLQPNGELDLSFELERNPEGTKMLLLAADDSFYIDVPSERKVARFFNKSVLTPTVASVLTGESSSDTAVTLAWETRGASSFDIERWDAPTSSWQGVAAGLNGTQYAVEGLVPGSEGIFRVRRRHADNSITYSQMTTARAFTSFENWKNVQGIDPYLAGSVDTDGDGIPALLEYALGMDPSSPDAQGGTAVEYTPSEISISYRKPRPELDYIVEVSSDLKIWTAQSVVVTPVSDSDQVIATAPIGDQGRKFIRLRVSEH